MCKPYAELVRVFAGKPIPYNELLLTCEWKEKRDLILKRDQYSCTKCKKGGTCSFYHNGLLIHLRVDGWDSLVPGDSTLESKPYFLHVHHKFYRVGRLPWEYSNDDLTTLCNWCHQNLHDNEGIVVMNRNGKLLDNLTPCQRCLGAGWFPEYTHIEDGICYRCWGERFEELINF